MKPESESFHALLSPSIKSADTKPKISFDTFAEWDSWDTINAVKQALECFSNVTLVEADYNAFERFKELKPDIVFNIAEGFYGGSREAQIPALLDMLGIPYTGSDPLTLAICLDKARTKEILSYYGIPTAKFFIADTINEVNGRNMTYPLMVKPVSEGSSKGIFTSSFVNNRKELVKETERVISEYNQAALVEEFLPGREFTVGIIGNGRNAEVLPIVEISYEDFPKDFVPIYCYEAKWILDTRENPLEVFSCPAKIDSVLEDRIKQTALNTFNVLRCRDWSRIDIRLDNKGMPNIIEVNPLPGILPDPKDNSCFPKAARTAGLSYNDMLNKVLYSAAKRYNIL